MTYSVKFLPHNVSVEVDDNESLIRAAMEAGVHINASCGGGGVCGKCRVLIEEGSVEGGISEHLSPEDQEKGYRLACMSEVSCDLVVRIPIESEIDTSRLNIHAGSRHTAKVMYSNIDELRQDGLFIPPVEKIYLELDSATAEDNQADVARIINHLRLKHGEHRLTMGLGLIRKISDIIREGDFKVTATIVRPVRKDGKNEIVNIEPFDTSDRNFAIAVDIGTTTVYGQVLDLHTGQVLSEQGEFNSQISYGEDVISRIIFAEKDDGLEILHQKVIEVINKIIEKILKRAKIGRHEVTTITLAGNSTMTQLLLKINPSYIRRDPYVPASIMYPPFHASEINIDLADHTIALIYPGVSSYVGGDIIAGIMASGMYRTSELTLYMDIGTNAEIAIGHKEWMVCTAASAGPAFEGGGVKFGMRATKGAIEDFSINPETYEPMIITVENKKAKGICGSGMITIAAKLLETGVIDSRGKFNQALDTPRIRQTDDIWEYVLIYKENTQIDRDITITEPDLDNLIRAKGAMYAAAITLLEEIGLKVTDIERIILAGGFGSYVELESAITIGLLPEIETEKVTYLGNGSLLGCKINSLTNALRRDVANVVNMMTNFEMAATPSYMDHYMGALFMPHTELNNFPKVKERLERLHKR
ncbi:MAG: ASKHA domain-containing protein [Desulfobacula sp.]|uniref:ASKHA domain-containing protein n=1 Tax=Desulfobacula sp. TaxID=2593537 RepID=UPI0025B8AD0A|nr:ASKHA domain-containing protein [Desulfobacula sp.]MCD4721543.1 ASKHA domain-containing protein [Desulfobacula sp.]